VFTGSWSRPFGLRRKLEDQVGPLDVFEAGCDGLAVDLEANAIAVGVEDATPQHLLTVGCGGDQTNLGELPFGVLVVTLGAQRPVEPGGAHFQAVVVANEIGDVEGSRQIT